MGLSIFFLEAARPGNNKGPAPARRGSADGFTLFEAVVMLAIVAAISVQVLASFTGLNQGAALQRSAQELALAVRQAQNTALAITQVEAGTPPTLLIPPAVGVRLSSVSAESSGFFLFADRDDIAAPRDAKYSGSEERIEGERSFLRGVRLRSLNSITGRAHIIFASPEAAVFLSDENGADLGETLTIVLEAASGQTKAITVRTSGQVSIQ